MEEDKEILLTEQETFDVLKFATEMIGGVPWSGVFTPDLINSAVKQINNNPLVPNERNLSKALNDPNNGEDALAGFNQWFDANDMVFKRSRDYLAKMLSFDWTYECINAQSKDYKSKEYKEDVDRIYKFFDKFNHKREFSKITNNMLRQETVFESFRDDADIYAFQQLPSKYCLITGDAGFTKLFEFNMLYFAGQVPGVDINSYAPIFKEYYARVFKDSGELDYRPSNPLCDRDGNFVYWTQTSPCDNFFCFKFSPEIYTKIPYLAPIMPDNLNLSIVRKLQMNKNLAGARALVMGEIGFLDPKSGSKADQLNLTPKTLATFIQLVKAALEEAWTIGGAPLKNLQKFQYEDYNKDMYDNQVKLTSGQSVALSRVIYSTDKLSQAEVSVKLQTDGNLMRALYQQFEDFVNYYINRKTRKYKFKIHFEGIEYQEDREFRLEQAIQLADRGIVLPQKIAAAIGMSPASFSRQLTEAQNNGFADKLISLVSINTQSSGGTSERGRPRKKGILQSSSRDYDDTNE